VSIGTLTPQRAALSMAARGCWILPVWWPTTTPDGRPCCACPSGSLCTSPAQHPLHVDWQRQATRHPATIRTWFRQWPAMNYGIHLGRSGLIVLDARGESGRDTMARLEAVLGAPLPRTWVIGIGSGRKHYYFDARPGFDWRTETVGGNLAALGLGPGVDVLSGDSFVLGPGCRSIAGQAGPRSEARS
jgi:hypothetical protein